MLFSVRKNIKMFSLKNLLSLMATRGRTIFGGPKKSFKYSIFRAMWKLIDELTDKSKLPNNNTITTTTPTTTNSGNNSSHKLDKKSRSKLDLYDENDIPDESSTDPYGPVSAFPRYPPVTVSLLYSTVSVLYPSVSLPHLSVSLPCLLVSLLYSTVSVSYTLVLLLYSTVSLTYLLVSLPHPPVSLLH